MILEILFAIPTFIFIWFFIFKIKLKYDKKKLIKDLPKKLEKQNKKFYSDGKEVDLKEILGLGVEKKEVTEKSKGFLKRTLEAWEVKRLLKKGLRKNE